MIPRPFWMRRLCQAWSEVPIAWLSGVRRGGKTTLARSLGENLLYLNCDLPAVEDMVRDPELFFRSCDKSIVVFDEIHQLRDPAHCPDTAVRYWRAKAGREVDFVLARRRDAEDAVECKWDPATFDPSCLRVFRESHPKGKNYLVTPSESGYPKRFGNREVRISSLSDLPADID